MGVKKAKVLYDAADAEGINIEFDRAVKNFFKSLGFQETGTGTDVNSNERDLSYSRVQKKGEG